VLVVGGGWASLWSTDFYDAATDKWTPGQKLSHGRSQHTATRLQDGKVLVVGGISSGPASLSSCEVFDPNSGDWNDVGDLNEARTGHTVVLLYTGHVMVAGGYSSGDILQSTEFFNPETAEWTLGPPMSISRWRHTATLLRKDLHTPLEFKVLVTGGAGGDPSSSAEIYTPDEVNV
jgi:hypothetical protein